VLKKKPAILK